MDLNTDVKVGKRLQCGSGRPPLMGLGPTEVNGFSHLEGPTSIGDDKEFALPATDGEEGGPPNGSATLMVGKTTNEDVLKNPLFGGTPFYSVFIKTYARIKSFLKIDTLLTVKLLKAKIIYTEVLMARSKNFIIDHPSQPNKKLVHACLEGPENAVYVRGRITNKTIIQLPYYWKDLVDESTITVQLQPIGAHQNIIVKRIGQNEIHLQGHGISIDCFYHVYAERKDIDQLEVEVD